MIPNRDPTSLTPNERLAEIAQILAAGYARLVISRQKALATSASAEALSSDPVNGNGAKPARRSS